MLLTPTPLPAPCKTINKQTNNCINQLIDINS